MKIIKIDGCWQCYHKTEFTPDICTLKKVCLQDICVIPKWCPLPDDSQPAGDPDVVG